MVYVALLRGINVGGKNKMAMSKLKETFESAGMTHVVTYINSGNIIFQWTADASSTASIAEAKAVAPEAVILEEAAVSMEKAIPEVILAELLETAIQRDFDLTIKVLVLGLDAMSAVMGALPEAWQNDDAMKSDVMFLWEPMSEAVLMSKLKIVDGIDAVILIENAVLWSVSRENVTRSGITKIVGTALYKKMTVRNVNTARKIYTLMQTNAKH
jgi:uncharacterized protein (DUF1697 family)